MFISIHPSTNPGSINELATTIETSLTGKTKTTSTTAASIAAEYSNVNGCDKIDAAECIDNNRTNNKSTNVILLKKELSMSSSSSSSMIMPTKNTSPQSSTNAVIESIIMEKQSQNNKDDHNKMMIVDKNNANDNDDECFSLNNHNNINYKMINNKGSNLSMDVCDANRNDENGKFNSFEISKYIQCFQIAVATLFIY